MEEVQSEGQKRRIPPSASGLRPVFTIGHSTLSLEDLIELLKVQRVTMVVDVRTVPRSRHNPQFNRESLPEALETAGIKYRHMPGLGGLRRPVADSPNLGWRNASFRGFADYMQTPDFERNLEDLIRVAEKESVVLMCAEAVPWRCHRSLIADALAVRGIPVEHILGANSRRMHSLTAWAHVVGGKVLYPAGKQEGAG